MQTTPQNAINWISIVAMLACSACGSTQSRTATFVMPASQQYATVKWDEAIAATSTAQVNNNNLISMR